ncbi:hypothetical protein C8R43DRAFT_1001939 [Mycena crocata]|nr:hypothetical protein C8R43DRAFT_1001939 [Mycena crocata]
MVLFIAVAAVPLLALLVGASPYPSEDTSLQLRTDSGDPQFPASPASCGQCQQNYDSIKLCISVAPVMANFSTVISNPGSFINVITCACTEPFKTTFPQCVDCFENTDQQAVLNMPDPDAVIEGINKVCALEQSIFGIGSGSGSTTAAPASTTGGTTTSPSAARALSAPFTPLLGAVSFMLWSAVW